MSQINLDDILQTLKKNPDTMYVSDTLMIARTNEDRLIIITGDFREITEEAANKILQDKIRRIFA